MSPVCFGIKIGNLELKTNSHYEFFLFVVISIKMCFF